MQLEKLLPALLTAALAIAIPIFKHFGPLLFGIDSTLKEQVNKYFFIPSYTDITKIIFVSITEENRDSIRKHIEQIHAIVNSNNARYYVPEHITFQLDELCVLFYNSRDIKEVNASFQKFCDNYFITFNVYKDSPFSLEYSIVPNHKNRIKKIRRKRMCIVFLISILLIFLAIFILYYILVILISLIGFIL